MLIIKLIYIEQICFYFQAKNADIDAWRGAKFFIEDKNNMRHFVTRDEYKEYGPDYIKEHHCSNKITHRQGSLAELDISKKKMKL